MRSIRTNPTAEQLAMSPRERVLVLANRIGEEAVARWCAELLSGSIAHDDRRRPSLVWLGGRHAALELRHGNVESRRQDYWPRVWAARGLLHVYEPAAEVAILGGLRDPAWRVRELCAKVARHHAIARAEPILARLLDDPVVRVREAADAALTASVRSPESHKPPASRQPRPRR